MSDFIKIIVFSLSLSVLWVIPRLEMIMFWISTHIWQSIVIALGVILFIYISSKLKQFINRKRGNISENEKVSLKQLD